MLFVEKLNTIIVISLTIIILGCSFGIIVAIKFQNKQKKKYNECLRLIKEKEEGILEVKNNIGKIKNVDANELMMDLYNTYIEFIDRLNNNNKDFNNILEGFIKELYENKIDIYNSKNHFEIMDDIELINYSILEYTEEKLKFRITTTCFTYKKSNGKIISGSNLERVEQIVLLTYINSNRKWLINNIEKVFEKKLSI